MPTYALAEFGVAPLPIYSKDLLPYYVPDPVFGDGEILTNWKLKVPVYIQLRAGSGKDGEWIKPIRQDKDSSM